MNHSLKEIHIIGAGLAGCEAAWQASRSGCRVVLYEMKPHRYSPAHHSPHFAELVCSNSLKSSSLDNASGLLKEELRFLNSVIISKADTHKRPAGSALAVDRSTFSEDITATLEKEKNITVVRQEITWIPSEGMVIIATGPLTSPALSEHIKNLIGNEFLYFH
ncbi:MAG: FAD-dependent oxidoreductase, partial [Proteobacteria bacterium]|nr:FAD-dependent oxidoreductase [Pseudomonadota bacterium]